MKKLMSLCLVFALLLAISACAPEQNVAPVQPSTSQNKPSVPTEPQKEVIKLTPENINEYLIFSISVSDVEKTDEFNNMEKAKGTLTVKTKPKKSGEFENVVLTISLETTSSGWGSKTQEAIEIPFDGRHEFELKINSYIKDYVSSSPSYKAVVTAVSGTFNK